MLRSLFNALNKIISRFVYLSDESAKRNRGLFSQRTFERMISKEVRDLANSKPKAKGDTADTENVTEKKPKAATKEEAEEQNKEIKAA